MSYQLTRTIDYFQTDPDARIKPDSFVRILQNAAISHVHEADRDSRVLIAAGFAWMINKISIDIYRHPVYTETLTVNTWHKGARGFKSYREYEIFCDEEKIAAATSSWLYLDLGRRKIIRVPRETDDAYGVDPRSAVGRDIEDWRPDKKMVPEFTVDITTRRSDYDMLGHVNNAAYFDYLDTLLNAFTGTPPRIERISIQYNKEVDSSIKKITAGIKAVDDVTRTFTMYDDTTLYACGEVVIKP
jgi:medium-chain acyl-[acyl-carrier-protein] hydrolase